VASLSQGRTAAAQCGLFTHKSVPVIFEPPCIKIFWMFVCDVIFGRDFHNTQLCQKFHFCESLIRTHDKSAGIISIYFLLN